MPRYDEPPLLSTREAFAQRTVPQLKPLALLLDQPAAKKDELVAALTRTMLDPQQLRALYASLDDVSQKAVQEATHHPNGTLDTRRFWAKYSRSPDFGGAGDFRRERPPTRLALFFPAGQTLPFDLGEMLRTFVPAPPPLAVRTVEELPSQVKLPHENEVELRVRPTARAALHDVKAVLRLIDAGDVKVGDKTRRPSQASLKAVAGVLAEGDFYQEEDQSRDDWDPAADLPIATFAWPMLLQAGGLASAAGTRLQLTAAGRKATTKPAHEVIRQLWERWQKTTLVDEFHRVSAIKGQQSKGPGLTAVASRRAEVADVLAQCPAGQWLTVDELFRLLKVLTNNFQVTHNPWKLYIADPQYGSLGYDSNHTWEMQQGRYALAFLFEYAATLGLIDVAYVSPEGARNDFRDCWGTDDLSCLSRYDGLLYLRLNALGAWCLGVAEHYEPEAVPVEAVLKVLPNREIVASDRPLGPADVLFLERFAERTSEAVWQLRAEKIVDAVEKGLSVGELQEFLAARSAEPLPQTVTVFLDDLATKMGQLEDAGTARLIACADAHVAQLLAHDRKLRALCQLAGERHLVFRAADETAVRRALRELGYVLPPLR